MFAYLVQWFMRQRFLKTILTQPILTQSSQFRNNLPFRKGGVLYFNNSYFPSHKNALY